MNTCVPRWIVVTCVILQNKYFVSQHIIKIFGIQHHIIKTFVIRQQIKKTIQQHIISQTLAPSWSQGRDSKPYIFFLENLDSLSIDKKRKTGEQGSDKIKCLVTLRHRNLTIITSDIRGVALATQNCWLLVHSARWRPSFWACWQFLFLGLFFKI